MQAGRLLLPNAPAMTPRERVLTAVAHEEPDRVPVGEWQYGPEIARPVLGDACLWLGGLARARALWDGRRDELVDQWKRGLVTLARHYQWDAVLVHLCLDPATPIAVPEPTGDGTWRTAEGHTLTHSEVTDRLFITKRADLPSEGPANSRPASTGEPPPDLQPTEGELEVVRHVVGELGQTHFLFAAALAGHPALSYSDASVSEVETWVRLYQDPDGFRDAHLAGLESPHLQMGVANVKREGLDGVAFGWDFGCTHGPFMSPALFRRCLQPVVAGWADLAHRHGLVMLLHSCGNNVPLMDMIVEAGVDVYQSIQTEMDIIALKQRYGKGITLWGGVPAGDLVLGTPEQVRREGREVLEACKAGGGYIYGTTHSVMPGAKHENYLAMLDAWRECAGY